MARKKARLQIAELLGKGLSYQQISEIAGVSTKTISRTKAEIQAEVGGDEGLKSEYQALLEREMGTPDRARRYRELASQSDQLMVSLKDLERIDDLLDLTTKKDMLRAPVPEAPRQQGPMFLMVGAHIEVHAPRREKVINMGELTEQVNAGETE
jgi:hypothetical protein